MAAAEPPGIDVAWRKSSYSSDTANCIEFATFADHVELRDSKDPDGPRLQFSVAAWGEFVNAVRADLFDIPAE
jgi:hypothetical protein